MLVLGGVRPRLAFGVTAVALISVVVMGPAANGRAQQDLAITDLVLLIDNSGSTAQTDPDYVRLDAVQQLIDTVAAYSDAFPFRIGAVAFGSQYFADSISLKKSLAPATEPGLRDILQRERVGGTDFEAALCVAWAVVTQQALPGGCPRPLELPSGPGPPAGPVRARVIVLVTDGFPAPRGVDLSFAPSGSPVACPSGGPTGDEYMCRVLDRWRALQREAPVSLYVVGLDRENRWFPTTEPYWRAITGCVGATACAAAVRRAPEPTSLVNDILNAATGNVVNLCADRDGFNECDLPASLAEVQFVVRGLGPNDEIRVRDPSGLRMPPGPRVSVAQTPGTQRWRVRAPGRGLWRVDSTNPGARLSVSQVLVPQRFLMQPDPAAPVAGAGVSFELRPEGDLLVDLPSLMSERFELRVQGPDGPETSTTTNLVRAGEQVFRTSGQITVGDAGTWVASLVLPTQAGRLLLATATFTATTPPTPSPTPSPTPIATSMPLPTPTPTPPECRLLVEPAGPRVEAARLAFAVGYPLRFSERQEFGARVEGPGCPAGRLSLTLKVSPADAAPTYPCEPPRRCEWRAEGVMPLRVAGLLDDQSAGAPELARAARVEDGSGWSLQTGDSVALVGSAWAQLEQRSLIGYWLPILAFLGGFYGVAFASSHQLVETTTTMGRKRISLRRAGVYEGERARGVTRWGAFVWRRFTRGASWALVSLEYLVAGRPVLRSPAARRPVQRNSHLGRVARWLGELRALAKGEPIRDASRSPLRELTSASRPGPRRW